MKSNDVVQAQAVGRKEQESEVNLWGQAEQVL